MKFKTQELVYITGDERPFRFYLLKVKYGLFGKYHYYLRDENGAPLLYNEQELIEFMNRHPKAKFKNEKL